MLISQGEHPKVISERLGHSSITVTFDVYGHLMPGMDESVAERLDEAWQRASSDGSAHQPRTNPGCRTLLNTDKPTPGRGFSGGRYWDRTSDLCRVKAETLLGASTCFA